MNKISDTWKIFTMYLIVLVLMLFCGTLFGQVKVVQFNAEWNKSNQVKWIKNLSDCENDFIDIGKDTDSQKKYSVVVVPTIIIFNGEEEVKRFQADLSFKMMAKEEEVQEVINEIIMSDF
tara:strand:- start:6560 stop:6919 length:360 start_codon:yes stop_codon:yes gene_type:complete